MKSPIQLSNYSEEIYEYTMMKQFEKRMARQRKRQMIQITWLMVCGALILGTLLTASILFESSIKSMILGL